MSKALRPSSNRVVLSALAAISISAILISASLGAASASAISVNLRVEGATQTQFNGTVTTGARSVPGGIDDPTGCRANSTAGSFAAPNGLTALADAVGDANISTSGTFFGWGTLLCGVNGEFPTTPGGGWLTRINQRDSTAPAGYVTATETLHDGYSVLFYLSPTFDAFNSSLELRLPATAIPGQPVTGYVDSYNTANDAKSAAAGASISGGGAVASAATDGSFAITFATAGSHLVRATRSGAIRGSAWVSVDPAATVTPITPPKTSKKKSKKKKTRRKTKKKVRHGHRINRFVLCRKTYKKYSKRYWRCIHIVRAKQRAEARRKRRH